MSRRLDFKYAFLKAIGSGLLPEAIAKGERIVFNPKRPKPSKPHLQTTKAITANTTKPKFQEEKKVIHQSRTKDPIKESAITVKPTIMDIDIAKRRIQTLKELASIYDDGYIINNLSYHCENPSKESLKLERRVFYKLFGAKPQTRELMSLFIANLASSGNPFGIEIINGLIKYFEQFSKWLNDNLKSFNSTQVYKPSKLFEKYRRFGRDEVYKLISAISKKITVRCSGIKNESIFPEVNQDMHKIFGSLFPIEF